MIDQKYNVYDSLPRVATAIFLSFIFLSIKISDPCADRLACSCCHLQPDRAWTTITDIGSFPLSSNSGVFIMLVVASRTIVVLSLVVGLHGGVLPAERRRRRFPWRACWTT